MPDQLHWTYGVSVACGGVWSRANQPRKPDLMTPTPEETVGKTTAYHLLNQSTIGTKFTLVCVGLLAQKFLEQYNHKILMEYVMLNMFFPLNSD